MMNSESANLTSVSRTFTLLIIFCSLAAYNLLGVPIQWLGQVGMVALAVWMLAKTKPHPFPGLTLILIYLTWAFVVTVLRSVTEDLTGLLPEKASTGYWSYVSLRFLSILTFMSTAYIANWLAEREGVRPTLSRMAWIGFWGGLYGLYIYAAQVLGWWEPPRNRMGTGGAEQSIIFSYAFHRAMGSFREPSHLAEWLIFPIYASLIFPRLSWLRLSVKMICMLLTGSLTGLLGLVSGLAISSIILVRHALRNLSNLLRPILPLFLALALASAFVVANKGGSADIVSTIMERIEPIFSDRGLSATNRGYVFQYYDKYPVPVIGQGLGNANIRFTRANHLEAIGSFLNLYICNLYAVGVIGFIILLMVLLYPLVRVRRFAARNPTLETFVLVSAYISWLFIFFVHSEELSVHFGVLFGLLVGVGREPVKHGV